MAICPLRLKSRIVVWNGDARERQSVARRCKGRRRDHEASNEEDCRLEGRFAPRLQPDFVSNPRDHVRLVVSAMDHALSLETSTCTRSLTASGFLAEVVMLDGIRGSLTDEQLNRFVESFPVERI